MASLVTVCRPRSVARIARSISRRRGWETREADPGWWSEETSDDGLEGGGDDDDASGPYGNAGAASRARTAAMAASVVGRGRLGRAARAVRSSASSMRSSASMPRSRFSGMDRSLPAGTPRREAEEEDVPFARTTRSPRARRAVDVVGDGFLALAPAPLRVDARVALFVPLIVSESAPEALERRSREASMARGDPGSRRFERDAGIAVNETARVDRARGPRERSGAIERGRARSPRNARRRRPRGRRARRCRVAAARGEGAAVAETPRERSNRPRNRANGRLFRPGEPVTEKRSARAPDWSEFG